MLQKRNNIVSALTKGRHEIYHVSNVAISKSQIRKKLPKIKNKGAPGGWPT